ncbi:MAG: tetratricopeptide repeat protein, partial [Planctomycetes bacterium]|nr:tetratricopeptide repeat protein [Planctomycetota bacterium]
RIPKDLETIVLKCLRKDPGERYGTAEALAQDLRRFGRGDPIEARPQAVLARLVRKASRHKGRLAVAGLVAILLAATGLLLERSQREADARRTADYESAVRAAVIQLQVRHPTLEVAAGKAMRVKSFLIDAKDFQTEGAGGSGDPAAAALAELEAAARSIPGRPDAHFQRARGLLLLGREDEAKAALEQAIRAAPDFVPARVLHASLLEKGGDRDAARREMEAVERSGRAGWAQAWLSARQALEEGKWSEAAAAYGKLIDMERAQREPYLGSSIELRMGRGLTRLEAKDFTGAIEDLVAARLLAPRAPQPGLLLGKAYFLKGEEAAAERTFEEVLEQARREPAARSVDRVALGVVAIYHYHLRLEEALRWAARIDEGSVREGIRAGILARLGRDTEACEAARKAIELNPQDTRAYANLGVSLEHLQRHAEGEEVARRGIAIDPDDFRLHLVLSGLLESMGKLDLAVEEGRKTIDLDRTSAVPFVSLGRKYRKQGDTESALAMLRKAIEVAPDEPWTHAGLGDVLAAQGKIEEALAAYRRALELDPRNGAPGLRALLLQAGAPELGPELERLLDLLESIFSGRRPFRRELSEVFQLASSALLARPGGAQGHGREQAQALPRSRRAAEATGRKQPEVLAALAEAQLANGLHTEAVLTLEEALSLPHAGRSLEAALKRCREALLPDLASYASIDAAIASSAGAGAGAEPGRRLLESFRAAARGETAASRVAYFEARLLEEAGRHPEAAEKLQPLVARGDGRPEPLLHLAECLRRAGDARGAEGELRDALARPPLSGADDLWRLWAAICFADLQRTPADMLASLPAEVHGYGADLRWLLERLASGRAIRIDCGGEEHTGPGGETWGQDRFFSSGYANFESWGRSDHYAGDIQGTEEDILYQTARWFPAGERRRAGYVIPLPRAAYRVTLHFAETWFTEPKQRSFGVRIEEEEVLKDYEPFSKGFAAADPHGFKSEVKDGVLDIELVHRVGDPMVSAIEIETIE